MYNRKMLNIVVGILVILYLLIRIFYFDFELTELLIAGGYYLAFWNIFSHLFVKTNRILCDKCNTANPYKSKVCSNCGNNIESVICPTCKGENPYNQKYCVECQTKLIEEMGYYEE